MNFFHPARGPCAQHQNGAKATGTDFGMDAVMMWRRISKHLMRNNNFHVVKVSPSRRRARGNARSGALFQRTSTALSTRVVDKGEILTLPATCRGLLLTPTTIVCKSGSPERGAQM
jgi:hypothetical protein